MSYEFDSDATDYTELRDRIRMLEREIDSVPTSTIGSISAPTRVYTGGGSDVGGSGGGFGRETEYIDEGDQDGTRRLDLVLDGDKNFIRKVRLTNDEPLIMDITANDFSEDLLHEMYLIVVQDSVGNRELTVPLPSNEFHESTIIHKALDLGPNEVTQFRFSTFDQGATWYIERVSLRGLGGVQGPPGVQGPQGEEGIQGVQGEDGVQGGPVRLPVPVATLVLYTRSPPGRTY